MPIADLICIQVPRMYGGHSGCLALVFALTLATKCCCEGVQDCSYICCSTFCPNALAKVAKIVTKNVYCPSCKNTLTTFTSMLASHRVHQSISRRSNLFTFLGYISFNPRFSTFQQQKYKRYSFRTQSIYHNLSTPRKQSRKVLLHSAHV